VFQKQFSSGPSSSSGFFSADATFVDKTLAIEIGTNMDTYGYIWICNHRYRYSMDTDTTISG